MPVPSGAFGAGYRHGFAFSSNSNVHKNQATSARRLRWLTDAPVGCGQRGAAGETIVAGRSVPEWAQLRMPSWDDLWAHDPDGQGSAKRTRGRKRIAAGNLLFGPRLPAADLAVRVRVCVSHLGPGRSSRRRRVYSPLCSTHTEHRWTRPRHLAHRASRSSLRSEAHLPSDLRAIFLILACAGALWFREGALPW